MAPWRHSVRRYVDAMTTHHRTVIVVLLVLTIGFGVGIVFLDGDIEMVTFAVESDERDALEFTEDQFASTDHRVTLVVVHGEDVLAPDSIHETMRLQEQIRGDERIASTLADDRSTVGIGNAIAFTANPDLTDEGYTIDDEIAEIDGHSRNQIVDDLSEAIEIDDLVPGDRPNIATLLPVDYQAGDTDASARLVLIVHDENVADDDLLTAQQAVADHVDTEVSETDAYVFGEELTFDRGADATAASFAIVGPLAVLLVFGVMLLAYRDLVDTFLSLTGIGLVLVWLAGFLGWTGIGINQLLVAVPCLLVGLSIDHGFHVLLRYREAKAENIPIADAMSTALTGVGVAIGATTITTMIGFLSGLISPIGVLREFAVASAFGILAAFLIFGAFVPAVKIEAAQYRRGTLAPISRFPLVSKPLGSLVPALQRQRIAVLSIAVLLALGGFAGFAALETSTERTDFLPDDPPAGLSIFAAESATSEMSLREEAIFLEDTFDREEPYSITILIHSDPTDPDTLEAVAAADRAAIEASTLEERTDGRAPIHSPLTVIDSLAQHDDAVAAALDSADSTGDGVPDREIASLYQTVADVDPVLLKEVVSLEDDGAVRVVVTVAADADDALIRSEMEAVAAAAGDDAIVTGEPILAPFEERTIVLTTIGTFLLALIVISLVLTTIFRYRHGSWILGGLTIVPVVLALGWVIAIMTLLDLPFNAETAIITGIAIGIGVDYTIHMTERFQAERKTKAIGDALDVSVVETGGTLLVSAVTTACGFAVLAMTLVPSLQRFGLITAVFVIAAFLASVTVLPILLFGWSNRS